MVLAVFLLSGPSAFAGKPSGPPDVPVIAGVSLSGKMTAVTSRLGKKGFVMTGFDKVSCSIRGPFEGMGEVTYAFWADADGMLDSVRTTVLSCEDWGELVRDFRAVENSLAAVYGARSVHGEDYGGDRDYSEDTRYMRLAMGYVEYFSEWEVGIWKIRESIVYENHAGCICVTMKKGVPEKRPGRSRAPKAPRERKVKPKKEKGSARSSTAPDGAVSAEAPAPKKVVGAVAGVSSSPWVQAVFRVRMGGDSGGR